MNDTVAFIEVGIEWLPIEERERLALRYFSPSALRRCRLAQRDDEVRAARRFVGDLPDTPAAKALAAKLDRYLASAWRHEKAFVSLPPDAGAERVALHRIASLNEGAGLGWRRVFDIFAGAPSE